MTTNPHTNKEWQRLLGHLPQHARAVAEQFPPGSKWQLLDDIRTYYTVYGVQDDGLLVLTRHHPSGLAVQRHMGIDPKDLLPWPEGRA